MAKAYREATLRGKRLKCVRKKIEKLDQEKFDEFLYILDSDFRKRITDSIMEIDVDQIEQALTHMLGK